MSASGVSGWMEAELERPAYRGLPLGDVTAADGGGDDLDADLHGLRRRHLHLLHHQRLAGAVRHRRCTRMIVVVDRHLIIIDHTGRPARKACRPTMAGEEDEARYRRRSMSF